MIATHYQIDFSEHYLADFIAARGIGFLGWNTRFRGFESNFLLDHALVDIGVGVRWLHEVAGRCPACGRRPGSPTCHPPTASSPDFVTRYRAAQIARNNAITDWAEAELKRVQAGLTGPRPLRCAAHS